MPAAPGAVAKAAAAGAQRAGAEAAEGAQANATAVTSGVLAVSATSGAGAGGAVSVAAVAAVAVSVAGVSAATAVVASVPEFSHTSTDSGAGPSAASRRLVPSSTSVAARASCTVTETIVVHLLRQPLAAAFCNTAGSARALAAPKFTRSWQPAVFSLPPVSLATVSSCSRELLTSSG